MAQIFPAYANTVARAAILGAAALGCLGLGLLIALPATSHVTRQDIIVEQPVQFSHEHHAGGLGIDCRYCHTAVERSRYAGIPPTHTCMTCLECSPSDRTGDWGGGLAGDELTG